MKRIISIAFLTLFFFIKAIAQEDYIFQFDTTKTLQQPAHFGHVIVLDNRIDTNLILSNGIKKLATVKSIKTGLENFGNQLVQKQSNKDQTLLVVLKKLSIMPYSFGKIALINANASFFVGSGNDFHYLFTNDTVCEEYEVGEIKGLFHTEYHVWEKMLNDLWYGSFTEAAYFKVIPNDTTSYSKQTAQLRDEDLKLKLPVYNSTNYPTGIYRTREEFLQLRPSITHYKEWDNGETAAFSHSYYTVLENGKKGEKIDPASFYAVYNGKRWYKSGRNGLYQMHFQDGDFYFNANMIGLTPLAKNEFVMGAIPAAASSIANSLGNESKVRNRQTSAHLCSIKLDAETGKFLREMPILKQQEQE